MTTDFITVESVRVNGHQRSRNGRETNLVSNLFGQKTLSYFDSTAWDKVRHTLPTGNMWRCFFSTIRANVHEAVKSHAIFAVVAVPAGDSSRRV